MIAKLVRIQGLVQGVFFRESLRREAENRGLFGWVRNRSDKSVEAFLQGDAGKVAELIEWCRQGPPAARVENVGVTEAEIDPALSSFTRRETV